MLNNQTECMVVQLENKDYDNIEEYMVYFKQQPLKEKQKIVIEHLQLLNTFTNTTGINLKESIEEIKVITPVDYALEGTINGSYYGERLSDLDNLLPRLLNKDHEDYIENLYSVNGFLGDLYEFDNTYYKAKVIADKVLREDSE